MTQFTVFYSYRIVQDYMCGDSLIMIMMYLSTVYSLIVVNIEKELKLIRLSVL